MELDRDLLGRLLLRVEANIHRDGWDKPAQLLVLYDWHDEETERAFREIMATDVGRSARVGQYAAQQMVPSEALNGNPANALFRFAMNVRGAREHPAVQYLLARVRQPGLLGLAFSVESWGRTVASQEERDALGKVRFADLPGSVEMRNIMATDVGGLDYWVTRERGKKPTLHRSDDDDVEGVQGAVVESLRAILAAIQGEEIPEVENTPSAWSWDDERRRASTFDGLW